MKSSHPKFIILAVYRKKGGKEWKGFCFPYDVTCYAKTKESAVKKLENLVKLYEEGLKKYHYPKHLALKKLSDKNDGKVLRLVVKNIATKPS